MPIRVALRTLGAVALSIFAASHAVAADQTPVSAVQAAVVVSGPEGQTRSLGVADLEQMSPREVTVTDPHGKQTARYRGVSLISVLSSVGTPTGSSLHGKDLALNVRVEAADGYAASFSLAELDAGFGNTEALLAFQRDGQPLAADAGPFRLVVPTDKRGGRWVRGLVKIRVLD